MPTGIYKRSNRFKCGCLKSGPHYIYNKKQFHKGLQQYKIYKIKACKKHELLKRIIENRNRVIRKTNKRWQLIEGKRIYSIV